MDPAPVTQSGLGAGLVPGMATLTTQEDPGMVAPTTAIGAVFSRAEAANTGEDPSEVITAVGVVLVPVAWAVPSGSD